MAQLTKRLPSRYDVLAEGLTADGRVVRRVEATADGLADVAEAFRMATAEASQAHLPVVRVRLTAGRAGVTEVAVVQELPETEALCQSAMLDGKTKVDVPPPERDRAGDALTDDAYLDWVSSQPADVRAHCRPAVERIVQRRFVARLATSKSERDWTEAFRAWRRADQILDSCK